MHGSTTFAINLETDHVILHGTTDESAGVILRGSVVLDSRENTKIKSITLKFQGRTKVQWTEGHGSHQRHYKEERTIIEHEWNFMPHKRKTYHLSEGVYKWDFELPLPGDLPSTIQHDLGQVYYRLKAVAERPAFSMNYIAKRNVLLSRLMLPSSLELNQSVVISNEWTDKLSYNISVPRKVFSCNSPIPIFFDLVPIASQLTVRSISCSLKEYITLSTNEHTKSEGRIVHHTHDDHFSNATDRWTTTEVLTVPSEHNIHSDLYSDLIKIKHKLKFTVSMMNADGHISELRAAIPIIIASLAPEEVANELPAYEDAWKSMPYDPVLVASLIASGDLPSSIARALPNEAASNIESTNTSTTTSSASSIDEDVVRGPEDPLPWWQGVDLSRVPSYSTACTSRRLYSFSGSLPAYDSLVLPSRTTAIN
ncbi:hypothetical protein INT45_013412 [Circinella minor]|uniref:Arrestin C-terminal-like domain-containing protein n=1 Tax=Circinella minor TaxID=1195481 RepID=A0A8H7VKI1_9FUNG|nr:hypothetical protein INT45_013412 [Circinella minor]